MPPQGFVALVLHAHLPWVRHPEYPDFLEEDWLFEAITETYAPLVALLDRLASDAVSAPLTMSLTPPLCEMLRDPLLLSRYERRLGALRRLCDALLDLHHNDPFEAALLDQRARLAEVDATWRQHNRDLIAAFAHHQAAGRLEILTCGATHGLLPLMATDEAREAQISIACANYFKHFGLYPRGIWLPECAFSPGFDAILARHGLRYFFLETHGVTFASPRPRFAHYRPVLTPAGPAAFARDPACSRQVWSADEGYPGDFDYREFYRDAGWDAPRPLLDELLGDGPRRSVGLKLHRVTGPVPLHDKAPYTPAWAQARVWDHARHFLATRSTQIHEIQEELGIPPLLTAPFDAELFGHWWSEGPLFLEALFRLAPEFPSLALTTPRAWLEQFPEAQVVTPAASSWGDGGYWSVWLNSGNSWIYKHLHHAEEAMVRLAARSDRTDPLERRALAQAGRELLLAQSSDWAFIITMGTTVPYAVMRTKLHLANFNLLLDQILAGQIDPATLTELEARSPIFSELTVDAWRRQDPSGTGGVATQTLT